MRTKFISQRAMIEQRDVLRLSLVLILLMCVACTSSPQADPRLLESVRWYTGETGTVDDVRAKALLEEALTAGHALSVMWLARVHSTGRLGFTADKPRAQEIAGAVIAEVETRANNGEAEASFLMGTAYAEALGKPLNPEMAVTWYRRAAEQGHVLAQHNLGNVHFSGTGVAQSDELAVYWWTQAAEQGDAIPQFRLGTMYEQGRGVPQDLAVARRWYRESAQRGNSNAREALNRMELE